VYFSVQLLYPSVLWLLFGTFFSFSLCSSIVLPSLVSIFMAIFLILYQVDYLCFTNYFSEVFTFFHWNIFLLIHFFFLNYVLVSVCIRWNSYLSQCWSRGTFSFNLAVSRLFLKFCNCPSSLFLLAPGSWGFGFHSMQICIILWEPGDREVSLRHSSKNWGSSWLDELLTGIYQQALIKKNTKMVLPHLTWFESISIGL